MSQPTFRPNGVNYRGPVRLLAILAAVAVLAPIPGTARASGPDADRFIVKFQAGRSDKARAALAGARADILVELGPQNAVAARIPSEAVQGLSTNPNIEFIEVDPPRYPMAETVPYGVKLVEASPVDGGLSPGSNYTPKVCIIDSGYDLGHPDLRGTSPNNDTVTGYPSNWSSDGCGHGTHVAGTVAALTGNSTGVTGVLGTGAADLHIVRVFGNNCSWAYASTLVDASNRCATAGANIISMSLGCSGRRCSSSVENSAFQTHYNNGILNIAAAGNDGNKQKSYPASYDSVVSVAALDSNKVVADFSQQNSQVEVAAPGVAVRSTLPRGTGKEESLSVGSTGYEAIALEGSPDLTGSGVLVDCGQGASTCASATGKTCLIERGDNTFADKVLACQNGGGVAAVIYNNAAGLFSGTLGSTATSIPSVGISQQDGLDLKASSLGQSASVSVAVGDYAYYDGTSMATPHVAGVAALIWTHSGSYTNTEIRKALQTTAEDLGPAGKDNAYGYGLVRAAKAKFCLDNPSHADCTDDGGDPGDGGGGGSCNLGQIGDACSSDSECCSGSCKGRPGGKTCK